MREIFFNVKFGLEFMTDTEARAALLENFMFEAPVYQEIDTMAAALQARANLVNTELNELFRTTLHEFDPLSDHEEHERTLSHGTVNSNSSGQNNSDVFDFTMNANPGTKRQVNNTGSTSNVTSYDSSDNDTEISRTGRRGSAAALIEEERSIILNMKKELLRKFNDLFMVYL